MAGGTSFRVLNPGALYSITDRMIYQRAQSIASDAAARSRVRTGRMKRGWDVQRAGSRDWQVFNEVPYTIYNEYGTRYMHAQPMLGPALAAARARGWFESGSVGVS